MQTCVNASENEINKKLEEQEINALVSCGFDKDIATALAKAVKKYSCSYFIHNLLINRLQFVHSLLTHLWAACAII